MKKYYITIYKSKKNSEYYKNKYKNTFFPSIKYAICKRFWKEYCSI